MCAAGIIICLASGIDGDRAIGQFRHVRSDRRINFLVAPIRWLVVEAIVVVIGGPTHHDRYASHRQDGKPRTKPEVVPMPRVMEVHINVVMHVDVVMHVEIMGPVERSLDRSGSGMFVHMPDASMVGTVDERRLTVLYGCTRGFAALCGLRTTAW